MVFFVRIYIYFFKYEFFICMYGKMIVSMIGSIYLFFFFSREMFFFDVFFYIRKIEIYMINGGVLN